MEQRAAVKLSSKEKMLFFWLVLSRDAFVKRCISATWLNWKWVEKVIWQLIVIDRRSVHSPFKVFSCILEEVCLFFWCCQFSFSKGTPFSKCFLWALHEMDLWIKSNRFRKHYVWDARLCYLGSPNCLFYFTFIEAGRPIENFPPTAMTWPRDKRTWSSTLTCPLLMLPLVI